jgi:hypothetical protein
MGHKTISDVGNGDTIHKVPMMIFLGSSPNNPFALLDIVDCTSEMAKSGKKVAKYFAGLLKPITSWIEQSKGSNNQKTHHREVVDLLLFDGASNVMNDGKLVSIIYPHIIIVHGAEHVVSLFFKDIFTKKSPCSNIYPSVQNDVETSLDQLIMVLMPSSRSTQSFTIITFTLGSLRLANFAWPEN